jgi:NitT/TauT family transport system permease protein
MQDGLNAVTENRIASVGSEPEARKRGSTRTRAGRHNKRGIALGRLAVLVVILAAWQIIATYKLVNPVLASSPRAVWDYLVESFSNGEMISNLIPTVEATLIAFGLASVCGIVIGLCFGVLPRVAKVFDPYITAINSLPRIALAPIFIIYFGINMSTKVALAFTIVIFVVLVNTYAGVISVDGDLRRLAVLYRLSKVQLFMKVLLPGAVPMIFAGLRLGITYAFLGVVTSELLAARNGLGLLVAQYANTFQMANVYGLILVLALLASIFTVGMTAIERHMLRWK